MMQVWKVVFLVAAVCLAVAYATPLDDYVNKPDPTYKWEVVNSVRGFNFTAYNVKLTSQTWMDPSQVSISVWTHWLQICVPDDLANVLSLGLMYIDGGGNADGGGLGNPPGQMDTFTGLICATAGTVVAHLGQVPNQPIVFASDPQRKRRSEDAMVAWTWREFLHNTKQPEWLARLPMTKAVVRAMDTVQSFMLSKYSRQVPQFVVAGASKRGWTTWTTAAVDKRVAAMIPIVMPMGNMTPLIDAMYRVYGNWSFALADYVNADVMKYLGTPEFEAMEAIIDPVVYYPRWHTMPKYVIAAAGDEFFLPDSTRYFWDQLPHPKMLRMAPNAEHSMITAPAIDVVYGIETFIQRLMRKMTLPIFDWKLTYSNTTASITAWASGSYQPSYVYLYQATTLSSTYRDFRLIRCIHKQWDCLNPVLWSWTPLPIAPGQTSWSVSVDAPKSGWTGFLIEAVYPGEYTTGDPYNPDKWIRITTTINVVPDRFPFESCEALHTCQPPIPWNP